jgi:hypothetical protein
LGDQVAVGGGGGCLLVSADLLVSIRMLIFLTAKFGCATKIFFHTPQKYYTGVH